MTLADKLEMMEVLWADISKTPDSLPAPSWLGEILAERRAQAEKGILKFQDWDLAIAELKKEIRENSSS